MDRYSKEWAMPLGAALICMVTVAAIAANLNMVDLGADGALLSDYLSGLSSFVLPTTVGLWAIVLLGFLLNRGKRGRRARDGEPSRSISTYGILILMAIIIILVIVGQVNVANKGGEVTDQPPSELPEDQPNDAQLTEGASFDPLTLLPLIMILAIVGFLAFRRVWHNRQSFVTRMAFPDSEELQVERIIAAVHSGGDVRGAIIEAYRQMYALVRTSLPGKEILTPRELEAALTDDLGWPAGPVSSLTRTFEEARYSDHPLDEGCRASALRDLELLRASLGVAQ